MNDANDNIFKLIATTLSIKPTLIYSGIVIFTYTLLKNIFLKRKQKNPNLLNKKLEEWINKINTYIIKDKDRYISKEYSLPNLIRIIMFIKMQNLKFCGDIIENMIIYIFSKAFLVSQDKEVSSYISNNLNKIREQKNSEFNQWIKNGKFIPPEFYKIESLLDIDGKEEVIEPNDQKGQSIFYNFLREIVKLKYTPILENINNNYKGYSQDFDNYFNFHISSYIYNSLKNNNKDLTILDKDIINNSQMNIENNLSHPISEQNIPITRLIHCFFTEVFIYYQNKFSPLLKYSHPSENLAVIPFVYDLRGACIEARFSYVIISPLRVGNFVSNIQLKQNNLREAGLFELGKLSTFCNIKQIELDTCLIRSIYLDYMIYAMGISENHSLEELNLSYNYLREDSDCALMKILQHFRELKVLNLSSNDLRKGLASVFIVLRKLYRKRKSKIETLVLNKCLLDETSFYELGELLKCKFCKLKTIYLNNNILPANYNFLQKLKKNKSLRNLYLIKVNMENGSVKDILKIISCSNIRSLYISKNNLDNFDDFLKILFRTKIINLKENKIINKDDTVLINLDISNNEYPIKNRYHINLLKKILQETSIFCLDMCHILGGANLDKKKPEDDEFNQFIKEIQNLLEENKKNYEHIIKEILKNKVIVEEFKHLEKEDFPGKNLFNKFSGQIYDNEDSIHPVHMKRLAKEIIEEVEKEKGEKEKGEPAENKIEDEKKENEEVKKEKKELDYIEKRKAIDILAKYLTFKNSEYNLKKLDIEENKKKLIII